MALQSISQNEKWQRIVGEAQEVTGSNNTLVGKETATSSKPNECPDGGSALPMHSPIIIFMILVQISGRAATSG